MAEILYIDEEGQHWLRIGECCHCGACCISGGSDPSILNPMFTDSERELRTLEGLCPLLRIDGDGYICLGHGEHEFYMNGCVNFPARPEDSVMYPDCSYSWELVNS